MKKKLLSLIMAVAMIASLAIPAFATTQTTSAATNGIYGATTTMSGQTRVAVVKVTLPASTAANKVILNPYELKLYTSSASGTTSAQQVANADSGVASADGKVSPQVITVPMELKSESDVPLMVGVTATATVAGDAKLSATHVDQSLVGTDKNVFLYVDMTRAKDGTQVTNWAADTAPKWRDDPSKVNTTAFPQVIPASGSGTKADKLFVIPAGDGSAANAKYAYFKVMGSTAPDPSKDWNASDTVSVKLAFTFAPTKLYPIQAHKAGSSSSAGSDYTVGYGDTAVSATVDGKDVQYDAYAAAGMPVVVKAKDKYVFSEISIIKPTSTADGTKEDDETRAATAVKVTDDTYYFIMPADKNGVVIRAGVESAS